MSDDADAGTSTWSAGLKLSARRNLTAVERSRVARKSQMLVAAGCGALAAAPIVLVLCGTVAAALLGFGHAGTPAELPLLLLAAVAAAMLFTAGRTWLRRGWYLRRDARAGLSRRFEGRVPDAPLDPTLRALLRIGLLRARDAGEQWLEVLPESGMVWQVNGVHPRAWYTAVSAEVADAPAFAAMAAEWVQPGEFGADPGVHAGQRELSAAERAELQRHIQRLTVRPLVPAAALTGASLAAIWLCGGRIPAALTLPFVWLVAGAVLTDIVLMLSFVVARRYRDDIALGRVIIVRFPPSQEEAEEGTTGLSEPMEVLPVSRMLWTEGGQPAGWRRSTPS